MRIKRAIPPLALGVFGLLVLANTSETPLREREPSDPDFGLYWPKSGKDKARAFVENLVSVGDTPDEAVANLGMSLYRKFRSQGDPRDVAHDRAWGWIDRLFLQPHTWLYELEGQGELASDLFHRKFEAEKL
jgi:hypothetical protein